MPFLAAVYLLAAMTAFASGAAKIDKSGLHFDREVLKRGQAEYKVND